MTTPSKAAIEAAEAIDAKAEEYASEYHSRGQVPTSEAAEIIQSVLDAETAGLRVEIGELKLVLESTEFKLGSLAFQIGAYGWSDASKSMLQCLQDGVNGEKARADRAVGVARRMYEAVRKQVLTRGAAYSRCELCWGQPDSTFWDSEADYELHTPTCLASPGAIKELEAPR